MTLRLLASIQHFSQVAGQNAKVYLRLLVTWKDVLSSLGRSFHAATSRCNLPLASSYLLLLPSNITTQFRYAGNCCCALHKQ